MPTNTSHIESLPKNSVTPSEESLVVDERAAIRPSEHVQSKLLTVLPAVAVPVSSLHTRRDTRRYRTS